MQYYTKSLACNYFFFLVNSVCSSLPLILSIFPSAPFPHTLSISVSLWWQCPAVLKQGQMGEIHLNTDATLWRLILSLCSTDEWTDHQVPIICPALIILILHLLAQGLVYFLTAHPKKFIERKNNLFFIVGNCGSFVVAECETRAWEVPVCLLIPGASAFEMFPPHFIAHQGSCHFHVLIPSRAKWGDL